MQGAVKQLGVVVRSLRKSPAYSLAALLTLMVGMGAATALFTVVNAVLLRPLPFPDAAGLVALWETREARQTPVSPGNFADWRERARGFEGLALVDPGRFNLSAEGRPVLAPGARVSGTFFDLLRVPPLHGRTLQAADEEPAPVPPLVLGHGLWQRHFGGDVSVVGRGVRLDGNPYLVVGVMPAGFDLPYFGDRQELWIPRRIRDEERSAETRAFRSLAVLARLAPGTTAEQAAGELATLAEQLGREHPVANQGWSAAVVPLFEQAVRKSRGALLLLQAAVVLLLVIAFANVFNLSLGRHAGRERERAIRAALGAGRLRLLAELVMESSVLCLAGGLLGLGLASFATRLLLARNPGNVQRLAETTIDLRVFGFALLLALVAGLVLGVAAALAQPRSGLALALREGGKSMGGRRRRWLENGFLCFEAALVLVLLALGGSAFDAFRRLVRLDPGFEIVDRTALHLVLPRAKYPDRERIRAFHEALETRVLEVPGVRSAAVGSSLPLVPTSAIVLGFVQVGKPVDLGNVPRAGFEIVSPGYFETLGIPLRQGRLPNELDRAGGQGVVVVNETMARWFWPGEEPIGRQVQILGPQGPVLEVVGVVGDVRFLSLAEEPRPAMYQPLAQIAIPWAEADLVVEAEPGRLEALGPALRQAVAELDPDQGVDLRPLATVVASSLDRQRFQMVLLAAFAAVALVLAAMGVYGVVSAAVSRERRQIGLRMALGASREHVFAWALRRGLVPVALGIGLGIVASIVTRDLLAGFVSGVGSVEAGGLALVVVVLLAVAVAACLVPARRASRVDPLQALQQD